MNKYIHTHIYIYMYNCLGDCKDIHVFNPRFLAGHVNGFCCCPGAMKLNLAEGDC